MTGMVVLLCLAGCKDEGAKAPVTAEKVPIEHPTEAACRKVQAHIFEITSFGADRLSELSAADRKKALEDFARQVDPADVKQCMEGDAKIVACMLAAPDPDKVRACVP